MMRYKRRRACVINEDIESPKSLDGFLHNAPTIFFLAYITLYGNGLRTKIGNIF